MARSKKALGKGISSLVNPKQMQNPQKANGLEDISLDLIKSNNEQPRKSFDEKKLNELSQSIASFGIIEPIIVKKKGAFYQIIAGERRFRASQKAGLKKIPAIIKDNLTVENEHQISLIENLQREDINPIEAGVAFKKLIEAYDYTHEDLAKILNKDRSTITNCLRLLSLPEQIQNDLIKGILTSTQARPLLALKSEKEQIDMRNLIVNNHYSVRKIEKSIKKKHPNKQKKTISQNDIHVISMQKEFESILKTKVKIKDNDGTGKIIIDYYSYDDFSRIKDYLC